MSIDTAHVGCSPLEKARTFEIAVARCGRGRRGSPPGHYFAMKIQPMQQIADYIVRCRDEWTNATVVWDKEIRALKSKLWH